VVHVPGVSQVFKSLINKNILKYYNKMKSEKLLIPDEIWRSILKGKSHSTYIGNLVLWNGRVYKKVYVDHTGLVLGEDVGGHDGISTRNLDFNSNDIKEIRNLVKVTEPKTRRQSTIYMLRRRLYGWIRKMAHRYMK
jgi:hypothetical protein